MKNIIYIFIFLYINVSAQQITPVGTFFEEDRLDFRRNTTIHDGELPYPILFVHGLSGSSDSWKEMVNHLIAQNLYFGGAISFNLEADNDATYTNIYNQPDINIVNEDKIGIGDFYIINFKCDKNGCYGDGNILSAINYSNQSAIAKQGLCIREAVRIIRQKTGKDKVILAGHSMGGLAIRQYVQNSNFYQADGKHHVAKLMSVGTPHNGSNITGSIFSNLFDVDEKSDAVRDLRTYYSRNDKPGAFLFGGEETANYLDDFVFGKFYNFDVNCNGIIGEKVTGLNNIFFPADLEYTCLCFYNPNYPSSKLTDGVVYLSNQNFYMTNPSAFKDYFEVLNTDYSYIEKPLHLHETKFLKENIFALDEPDYYNLAYKINLNQIYRGYTTEQGKSSPSTIDYDDYQFTIPSQGKVRVSIQNANALNFNISILGIGNSYSKTVYANGLTDFYYDFNLSGGSYYLEIAGMPTDYRNYYLFQVAFTPNTGTAPIPAMLPSIISGCEPLTVKFTDKSSGDPTNWNWTFPGGTPSTSTNQSPTVVYSKAGNYDVILKVSNNYGSKTETYPTAISVTRTPTANFNFTTNKSTVNFIDASTDVKLSNTYLWNFGDGYTSLLRNPTHVYAKVGNYSVSLSISDPCGIAKISKNISILSTLNKEIKENTYTIYPNPTSSKVEINTNYLSMTSVFDILGHLLLVSQEKEINIGHLPNGVYIFEIQSNGEIHKERILKQQ